MKVAVLGLGAMGAAIARRLQDSDVELTVYNRSPGPVQEFADGGVNVASSPAEAAEGADVAISMLSDGSAVEAVLLGESGVLGDDGGRDGRVTVIDMSTIDVPTSERIAARAADAGAPYLR